MTEQLEWLLPEGLWLRLGFTDIDGRERASGWAWGCQPRVLCLTRNPPSYTLSFISRLCILLCLLSPDPFSLYPLNLSTGEFKC